MTHGKRLLDIGLALLLSALLLPLGILIAFSVILLDGRPVFYISERMRSPDRAFTLIKFRTMRAARHDHGVSGGDKTARITRIGQVLRRTRLDELPQLWNVLAGHMSFVGPRPPLREYVERFPALYEKVLLARPGITGLATLKYHRTEERLLARCTSAAETDAVYARRCVPRKARLDLIYLRHRSLCWDVLMMLQTVLPPAAKPFLDVRASPPPASRNDPRRGLGPGRRHADE